MTDSPDNKQAALDALRAWRGWSNRRDPLIYAAHRAGASLAEIHEASQVAVNTARSAIAAQEEPVQTTAPDPLAQYHHPHFVAAEQSRFGDWKFTFKPFTGRETKPWAPHTIHSDDSLSSEQRNRLFEEYAAAEALWGTTRFHLLARALVTESAPLWTAYRQTRTAMDEAFEALLSTNDNSWRAQIMKLTNLHHEVLEAARTWDEAGKRMVRLHQEYRQSVKESEAEVLRDMISRYGIDTEDWKIGSVHDYESAQWRTDFTPVARRTVEEICWQKARIREAADLAGDLGRN